MVSQPCQGSTQYFLAAPLDGAQKCNLLFAIVHVTKVDTYNNIIMFFNQYLWQVIIWMSILNFYNSVIYFLFDPKIFKFLLIEIPDSVS